MTVEFGPVHSMPPEELEPATLLDTTLRVWAELGRTRMPASTVVGMAEGAILALDRESDEPADLYVNGRHFGTCRLILVDNEWALRIESLDHDGEPDDDEVGDEPDAVEQVSNSGQGDPEASD
jgi:flagellar motor switch/type III secretory pathway protein FliN